MSLLKKGKVLPATITDELLAQSVSKILRTEHASTDAAIKRIERMTGANSNTICKWYQGRNAPKSAHLLLLAKHYPAILCMILEITGKTELCKIYEENLLPSKTAQHKVKMLVPHNFYSAKNCTINPATETTLPGKLNQRQLWFLESIQQGNRSKAADVMSAWNVSGRTAKYDVAGLVDLGLIHFVGARKTGRYILSNLV